MLKSVGFEFRKCIEHGAIKLLKHFGTLAAMPGSDHSIWPAPVVVIPPRAASYITRLGTTHTRSVVFWFWGGTDASCQGTPRLRLRGRSCTGFPWRLFPLPFRGFPESIVSTPWSARPLSFAARSFFAAWTCLPLAR